MLPTSARPRRATPSLWLALAAVTLLAAGVRFWQLSALPPGYWYDEAHKSLVALEIARGEQAPVYVTDYQGLEAGFFWLLAGWFRLVGPSFFGARVLSATLGTLTIPLTFWTIQELYRTLPQARLLALLAAAWLSFLLWHVHWSRTGYETILVPMFAVALLGAMAWAWQRRTPAAFALAGVVLGLSQYTNPAARLLLVQALVTFFMLGRGNRRERLTFGAVFGAAALVVYLPLGLFFWRNPEWFVNRITFTSTGARAGGLPALLSNAAKTLWSINVRGDVMTRHNLSLRPALDPIASLCMAAAVPALWAWRAHWRPHAALLTALGLSLVPMVFSDGAPGFGRTLGASPFIATLPALGLVYVMTKVPRPAWATALAVGCVALSAAFNVYDYFGRYPRQPGLFDAFEVGQWTLIDRTMLASQNGIGYLILNDAGLAHPGTRLARRLATGDLRALNGLSCLAYPAHATQATTIGVLAEWAPLVQAQFPTVPSDVVLHEPEVYPYAYLFHIAPGTASVAAGTPEVARLGENAALLAASLPSTAVAPGDTVSVALRWRALAPSAIPLNVFLHVGQPLAPPIAGADGEPCGGWYGLNQWHPNEIIEHQLSLTLPADIAPGTYPVFVGLYDWVTGQRLSVEQPGGLEPDQVLVGSLVVQ